MKYDYGLMWEIAVEELWMSIENKFIEMKEKAEEVRRRIEETWRFSRNLLVVFHLERNLS